MTRAEFITELLEWEGTPYHTHAAVKRVGCDCVGLLVGALKKQLQLSKEDAVLVNTYAEGFTAGVLGKWMERNFDRIQQHEVRAGDILVFNIGGRLQHVAVLIEKNKIIHAQQHRNMVTVNTLADGWRSRWSGAYAVRGLQ